MSTPRVVGIGVASSDDFDAETPPLKRLIDFRNKKIASSALWTSNSPTFT